LNNNTKAKAIINDNINLHNTDKYYRYVLVLLHTSEALLRNTIIFNSTGLPAISIPIGLTKDNMPIGIQIIGAPFREDLILSIAYNCETIINNKDMDKFIPPLCF
jgi:hypothetical protein